MFARTPFRTRTLIAVSLILTALIIHPAHSTDISALTEADQATAQGVDILPDQPRDIQFPASESIFSNGTMIANSLGGHCTFSPDAQAVYVVTSKNGAGLHINKVDTRTGKFMANIPLDLGGYANNPLKKLLAPLPLEDVEAMATFGNTLAVMVQVNVRQSAEAPIQYLPILFDATTGKPLKVLGNKIPIKANEAGTLSFSQDGRYLIARAECHLYVWDVSSGKLVSHIPAECFGMIGHPTFVGLSGGTLVYLDKQGDREYQVNAVNLQSQQKHELLGPGWTSLINTDFYTFSPFGKKAILEAKPHDEDDPRDPDPQLFTVPGMQAEAPLTIGNGNNVYLTSFPGSSRRFQWSPDNRYLLMVGQGASGEIADQPFALLFDVVANRPVALHKLPLRKGESFYTLGVMPDNTFLIAGRTPRDKGLRILKLSPH